ncbi:MAG: phosphate acyltransferase PlsX [Chitinophagales bacterium]|nr:phosphate acyltransferase PlsX [Chitinophagales bacterium]MDW8428034.1 phosphate acyltransferase PlsX [Chitinophagales bacterium]
MPSLRIGIDAMGGDYAPQECVHGVALALSELPEQAQLVLFGQAPKIEPLLEQFQIDGRRVSLVHCEEVITMAEAPTRALQQKPKSSIAVGFQQLREGTIDAFAGAGNTGAMLVGAMYSVRTINGVLRPALTTVVPRDNDHLGILLDVGANVDCRPEMLLQFGILGSLYARYVYHIEQPRVALVSIGEEEGKGNQLVKETAELMRASRQLHFIGNIEGRHIFSNLADVMVCDGFVGNIILKFGESIYDMVKRRGITDPYWDRFNYENYGGTGILGVNAPVVVAHGISNAKAFRNMILLTRDIVESRLVERFREAFLNFQAAELG